uniref:Uncharacterized protein n=1 Tax=Cacopsylla melanoneura TaxID=428564 RepID=A0A8D8ZT29_9HEMI
MSKQKQTKKHSATNSLTLSTLWEQLGRHHFRMFQRVRNHSKVRMFLDGRFPVQMLLLSRDTEQVRVNNVREKLRPQFQQKFDQWPQVVCKPTSRSLVDRELAKTFGQGFVMMNDLRAVFGGACAGTIVVIVVVIARLLELIETESFNSSGQWSIQQIHSTIENFHEDLVSGFIFRIILEKFNVFLTEIDEKVAEKFTTQNLFLLRGGLAVD